MTESFTKLINNYLMMIMLSEQGALRATSIKALQGELEESRGESQRAELAATAHAEEELARALSIVNAKHVAALEQATCVNEVAAASAATEARAHLAELFASRAEIATLQTALEDAQLEHEIAVDIHAADAVRLTEAHVSAVAVQEEAHAADVAAASERHVEGVLASNEEAAW